MEFWVLYDRSSGKEMTSFAMDGSCACRIKLECLSHVPLCVQPGVHNTKAEIPRIGSGGGGMSRNKK